MALVNQCNHCQAIFKDYHLTRGRGFGLEVMSSSDKSLCRSCALTEAQKIIYFYLDGKEQ